MSAQFKSEVISLNAPIGGWDAFHGLDDMPPDNAIVLENLIPQAGTVVTRLGTITYADTGTGAPVETVASYFTRNDSKLLAFSAGGAWDITDPQPAQAGVNTTGVSAQVVTELKAPGTYGNDRWQQANFRKLDEEGVLILCNGVDQVQVFDGTALADATFNDGEETPAPITIPFIGCVVFKGRTYYWADDDNSFYYAVAGAYQGELKAFELGSLVQKGGKIKFCTSWTQTDSGDGKDDFFVVVFDTGETLIYQGDDPATLWEQVGRYNMPEPLSIRGEAGYGSDRIIMTKDGYVGLASVIQQGTTSDVPQFSRMISSAIKAETALRGDKYGWDCQLFQKQGLFIFNVPLSGSTFNQHVLNTVTGAWCRFSNINVNCLEVHNQRLFGGAADGTVIAMLETTADLGGAITFTALPAYNYLGNNGVNKHLTAIQPLTTNSTNELMTVSGYADFDVPDLLPVAAEPQKSQGIWSIDPAEPPQQLGSYWDEDYWATDLTPYTYKGWQNISALGYAVSYLLRFAKIDESVTWRSTGLRFYYLGAQ